MTAIMPPDKTDDEIEALRQRISNLEQEKESALNRIYETSPTVLDLSRLLDEIDEATPIVISRDGKLYPITLNTLVANYWYSARTGLLYLASKEEREHLPSDAEPLSTFGVTEEDIEEEQENEPEDSS